MLTALIVAVAASALNAWLNIQIKFAATKEEAITAYRKLITKAGWILIFCFILWQFTTTALSPDPVTRGAVAYMIGHAVLFVFNAILLLIMRIVTVMEKHADVTVNLRTSNAELQRRIEVLEKTKQLRVSSVVENAPEISQIGHEEKNSAPG